MKKESVIKIIGIFELVLIMSLIFSFPIILYGNYNGFNSEISNFVEFLDPIKTVSAQEIPGLGEVFGDVSNEVGPTGCCFDTEEGLCSPNSGLGACELEEDGKWFGDASCSINQCTLGCCVLGSEAQLTTKRRCEKLGELHGLPSQYNSAITDEFVCIGLADLQLEGACVIEDSEGGQSTCKFGTNTECQEIGGEFNPGFLCSHPDLETECEPQHTTNCVDGEDEVYWFDSCGNRENIYDSNKDRSFNNGEVLSKEQSCGQFGDNSNSRSCGNCDFDKGSICGEHRPGLDRKKTDGEYVCRDLNCKDGLRTRKNGESWCIYDGQIGNGKDTVGSRHFRAVCNNGEIEAEPCADYRKEVCVETDAISTITGALGGLTSGFGGLSGIGDLGGITGFQIADLQGNFGNFGGGLGGFAGGITGGDRSGAFCRPNLYSDCTGRDQASCSQNPDCYFKSVEIDDDYEVKLCLPSYPPGSDLGGGLGGLGEGLSGGDGGGFSDLSSGGAFSDLGGGLAGGGSGGSCDLGLDPCVVVYEKKCPSGEWECEENCDCEEKEFTEKINDLCKSMGDCGVYVNFVGQGTTGGHNTNVEGGKAEAPPKLFSAIQYAGAAQGGLFAMGPSPGFYNSIPGVNQLGSMGIANNFGGSGSQGTGAFNGASASDGLFGTGASGGAIAAGGGIGAAAGGAAGVVALPGSTGALFGGPGFVTNVGTIGGFAPVLMPVAIGAILGIGIVIALGCGEQEESEITFECKAWQRPAGGNCAACNDDPQKPCSKYRCEALGSNCMIINEGTGFDECVTIGTVELPPVITPLDSALSEGYKIESFSNGYNIKASDGGCVDPFDQIEFGVKTSVPATCRIGESEGSYDDLGNGFIEGEILRREHTTSAFLPSADSLIAEEVSNSDEFQQVVESNQYQSVLDSAGEATLYVKCRNTQGVESVADYRINICVNQGPDLTPPIVVATSPPVDSFVSFNITSWETRFFINEPSECKWDATNIGYFDMANALSCEDEVDEGTLLGYPCTTTFPLDQEENTFYVKCRDQPWLEDSTERNIGTGYEYNLFRTATGLSIDQISPEGDIIRGAQTGEVELFVRTVGGLANGEAVCQYQMAGSNVWIDFFETFSNEHNQILNLASGEHTIDVRCADAAANLATGSTTFNLDLDTEPPKVTRVYYDFGNLVVLTDEDATCSYRNDKTTCNFDLENGTSMGFGNSIEHITEWSTEDKHYVKCRDIWGNEPDQCTIVVKPYDNP